MDSFEVTKLTGAVLATIFVLFGGSLIAEGLFHAEVPETAGYAIVAAEPEAGSEAEAEPAAAVVPVATLLASADPQAGAAQFKKCQSCHSGEEGGPNKVGPNLWSIVNRPIASNAGFSYSTALTGFAQGGTVPWDFEHLNGFILNPKGYVNGTAMGFAGVKDDKERADLLAYLNTLSATPALLPEAPAAEAVPAAAEAAPAATAPADGPVAASEGDPAPDPATAGSAATGAGAGASAPEGASTSEAPAPAEAAPPAPAEAAAPPAPATAPIPAVAEVAPVPVPAETAPAAEPAPAAAVPAVAAPAEPAAAAAPPAAAPAPAAPQEVAAATGDAKAGAQVFKKCQACHAVGAGAANKVGPELNGIVGEATASVEGYSFSAALKKYAEANPVWTEANLTAWLTDPKGTVPGTKMAFPGLKKPAEIANVIAYLKSFDETGAPAAPAQ